MKTKHFKEILEGRGYHISTEGEEFSIWCPKFKRCLIVVNHKELIEFEVTSEFREEFGNNQKGFELLQLVIEYVYTDIEDRKYGWVLK